MTGSIDCSRKGDLYMTARKQRNRMLRFGMTKGIILFRGVMDKRIEGLNKFSSLTGRNLKSMLTDLAYV